MDVSLATTDPLAWWRRHRSLFLVAGWIWIGLGLVQCAQTYVLSRATGRPWALSSALVNGMPWWLSWLALTPLIAWLAERFPFGQGRPWGSLAAHVVSAMVVACLQLPAVAAVYWLTTGQAAQPALTLPNEIARFFGSYFLESVVTYGAAAGAFIAIDSARSARAEAEQRAQSRSRRHARGHRTRARLDALAMELNPHFLFNTLSAISGLLAQGRTADARDVIRRLGELLRQTLGSGAEPLNTVAREVELLGDYLFIQGMRFSDRLRVTLDVDAGAHGCLIPAMLLQPLVENAIRHGVEPREGMGDVRVCIARSNGALRIAITDSGDGFALADAGRPAHEGIGIGNTRARLRHLYGASASLTLDNLASGGASAVVVLPVRDAVAASDAGRNG